MHEVGEKKLKSMGTKLTLIFQSFLSSHGGLTNFQIFSTQEDEHLQYNSIKIIQLKKCCKSKKRCFYENIVKSFIPGGSIRPFDL